jgi:chromatin remodeling complex protein RSC6
MSSQKQVKRSTTQSKKAKEVVEEPVVEQEVADDESDATETTDKKTRTRRVVTKESLISSIQELNTHLETILTKQTESGEKNVIGKRFVSRVHKALRVIESDAKKVLKMKSINRKADATSGFMKPVMISEEMAKFTGLDKNGAYPRPTITKFVCDYIKSHNLQNPKDRREFKVDSALQKLLKYNPNDPPKDDQGNAIPMTYFRLQKYMQHHFKQSEASVAVPVAATPVPVVATATATPVAVPADKTSGKRKAK